MPSTSRNINLLRKHVAHFGKTLSETATIVSFARWRLLRSLFWKTNSKLTIGFLPSFSKMIHAIVIDFLQMLQEQMSKIKTAIKFWWIKMNFYPFAFNQTRGSQIVSVINTVLRELHSFLRNQTIIFRVLKYICQKKYSWNKYLCTSFLNWKRYSQLDDREKNNYVLLMAVFRGMLELKLFFAKVLKNCFT